MPRPQSAAPARRRSAPTRRKVQAPTASAGVGFRPTRTASPGLNRATSALDTETEEDAIGPDWAGVATGVYLNNRKVTIYGGTSEVQHNILAKAVLGL